MCRLEAANTFRRCDEAEKPNAHATCALERAHRGYRTAARGQHGVQHEEVALLQVVSRSAAVAVAIGAFVWSLEHALIPLTFDPKFMTYRILAPLPFSTWQARLYLRLRQLVPSPARTP